ncbi:hypothetical protein RB195_024565 [Necator americanus]|uniref:Uncharacterized protein n=1 Tax=Necator americanus TaxID=51031 RepID=A0ABR1EQY2_NECAM
MTRGKGQYLAQPSEVVMEKRLRFSGHVMGRPSDHLAQVVLTMLPNPNWKRTSGRKRKLWSEVVKEDLRRLGVDRRCERNIWTVTWSSRPLPGENGILGNYSPLNRRTLLC